MWAGHRNKDGEAIKAAGTGAAMMEGDIRSIGTMMGMADIMVIEGKMVASSREEITGVAINKAAASKVDHLLAAGRAEDNKVDHLLRVDRVEGNRVGLPRKVDKVAVSRAARLPDLLLREDLPRKMDRAMGVMVRMVIVDNREATPRTMGAITIDGSYTPRH